MQTLRRSILLTPLFLVLATASLAAQAPANHEASAEPQVATLKVVVDNRNFTEVTIYLNGATVKQLGDVQGKSQRSFTVSVSQLRIDGTFNLVARLRGTPRAGVIPSPQLNYVPGAEIYFMVGDQDAHNESLAYVR